MDGERLQPELRRAAHDRVGARRPLRTAAAVRGRPRALRPRVGRVRARADRGLAHRGADRAGRGRGVRHAARARARERRVPRRAPRVGDRRAAGPHGPGGRDRAGHRRRGRAGHLLELDLLDQRADRARRRAGRAGPHPREPRPRPLPRPARPGAHHARGRRGRVGPRARQPGRLGQRRGPRIARRRGAAAGRVPVVGGAGAGADAAARDVPLARVLGGQRRDLPDVRVAVRRGVLPRAVPAVRPRRRRPRRRAAAAALDGDAVLRRARGRGAGRPLRRAPVPRRRAAAAGHRPGLDRARRRPGDGLHPDGPRPRDRRLRRVDGAPVGAERGHGRRRAGGGREGVGREQHAARAGRRVRDRGRGGGVQRRGRLRVGAGVHRRLHRRDRGVGGAVAGRGDRRGSSCRRASAGQSSATLRTAAVSTRGPCAARRSS